MNVVILAAGKGERLGTLTQSCPKPMIRIRGTPILEHNIDWCRKNGFTDLFINLHHLPDAITSYFKDGAHWGVSITYKQEAALLGTAGAVKNFEAELGGAPFLVIYGDNWVDYDLAAMMKRHVQSGADMSIAVFRLADVRQSGVVSMDKAGRIAGFVEKPDARRGGWVNAGVYIMDPGLLRDIPSGFSDFGRDIIPGFIRRGRRLLAVRMPERVKAIDTPALYKRWVF